MAKRVSVDGWLFTVTLTLVFVGLVMVFSASAVMAKERYGSGYYFLLRQVGCPIHGVRVIRLPGHRFRAELSEEVQPARDAAGQIDVQGTMQAITSVVESWIREYPDQWLWLHRRWR